MKYHIDTIPVWDALHSNSECPLCALKRRTERLLVERSLGASVMSPDTRIKVNEKGFCGHHSALLYNEPGSNRLGHGLMMLSHLQTLRPALAQAKPAMNAKAKPGFPLFRKGGDKAGANSANAGANSRETCLLCDELREQSQRQAASLLHLYKTDPAFREAFQQSKGLCVPHTEFCQELSSQVLGTAQAEEFNDLAGRLLRDSLKRLEEELAWFTQKFDYRNAQEPWGTSKDALERTINKLRGWCLGSEPMQDEK